MLPIRWLVVLLALSAGCGGTLVVPAGCVDVGCPCDAPSDCAATLTCSAGKCAQPDPCSLTSPNGPCPEGRICSAGVCSDGTWCANCSPGQACDDGVCVDITADNLCSEIRPDGVCEMGKVCLRGNCIDITPDNECSASRPSGLCPDGASCVNGVCIPTQEDPCGPTNLDGLCASGLQCMPPGECRQPPCSPNFVFGYCGENSFCSLAGSCIPQGTCLHDGDCGNRFVCHEQNCLRDFACNGPDDCLIGEQCAQTGQCMPIGSCVTAAECDAGQRCSNAGTCVASNTCDDNDDCAPPQRCGSGRVCLDPNACSNAVDCPPGHACHSGTCAPSGVLCTELTGTPNDCSVAGSCCGLGQRCSAAGSCIPVGACVTDDDCLLGSQVCSSNFLCEAVTSCNSVDDCAPGERCAQTGVCIPANNCLIDLDCSEGEICSALYECVPNDACGTTEFQTTLVKPNMLIVFDRSTSMAWCIPQNGPPPTRWEQALSAINQVVTDNSDKVRFGLSTYPALCPGTNMSVSSDCNASGVTLGCPQCNNCVGSNCTPSNQGSADCPAPSTRSINRTPGGVDVSIGENRGPAIMASLNASVPGGYTPTGPTLRNIRDNRAAFGLPDPNDTDARGNYILLITDGEANYDVTDEDCNPSGDTNYCSGKVNAALRTLRALNPPIQTFVVGFAFCSVNNNLNCNAVWGGTSLCSSTTISEGSCSSSGVNERCSCTGTSATACYYQANDAAALTQKFEEIVGQVASCTYSLNGAPPDVNRLYVFLSYGASDPVSVPRGPSTWDYDAVTNQVSLFGATCDDVKNAVATPKVVYGCPDNTGG